MPDIYLLPELRQFFGTKEQDGKVHLFEKTMNWAVFIINLSFVQLQYR
ncbi:hypothetical protein Plano_2288 [Planococcus sp. PAMC 21323]|nr:hypothetical protein Plano_2288 [Planococcus sp. PAMC 21323]